MFPERFYSPRCSEVGVASPSRFPLFRVLEEVFFHGLELKDFFFFFPLVVFASRWHPLDGCGAAAREKLVGLAAELM